MVSSYPDAKAVVDLLGRLVTFFLLQEPKCLWLEVPPVQPDLSENVCRLCSLGSWWFIFSLS